jgi:hypothetical protein
MPLDPTDINLNVEAEILNRAALGLRNKMSLDTSAVYIASEAIVPPNGDGPTIQVINGSASPEGEGAGGQWGGSLIRRMQLILAVWLTFKTDEFERQEDMITSNADGMLNLCGQIKNIFDLTTLGGILLEPIEWEGASNNSIVGSPDESPVFIKREIYYSCVYAETRSRTVTLDESDVTV